jgi:hypothetical protein
MFRSCIGLFTLISVVTLLLLMPRAAGQDDKESKAVVLSPKAGTKVGQFEQIEGKVTGKGWPVVLVKPLVGGQPWYVQASVEDVSDGKFTIDAQFGDERTEKGTKFRVIILVTKSRKEAANFKPGAKKNAPPAGLPKSEQVDVTRE